MRPVYLAWDVHCVHRYEPQTASDCMCGSARAWGHEVSPRPSAGTQPRAGSECPLWAKPSVDPFTTTCDCISRVFRVRPHVCWCSSVGVRLCDDIFDHMRVCSYLWGSRGGSFQCAESFSGGVILCVQPPTPQTPDRTLENVCFTG